MPKIQYKEINFRGKSLELINLVNQVINEYKNQGYELTLRQTYYQLVARGYIPNNERSYKNIGNLINDGRLAGLIDWYSIVDRTRNLRGNSHWDKPEDVIASARYSYLLNKWDGQPNYVEVWVEKDALVDIVGQACIPLDTPYFSCRGYTSQSEMWSAAQRFIDQSYRDNCYIIHLGDHDPSGIDMTRDIQERLQMFGADVYVKGDTVDLIVDGVEVMKVITREEFNAGIKRLAQENNPVPADAQTPAEPLDGAMNPPEQHVRGQRRRRTRS